MAGIIQHKADVDADFAQTIANWLTKFGNRQKISRKPSIAEGIDWARYLSMVQERDQETAVNSSGILFKNEAGLAVETESIASNSFCAEL